MLFLGTAAQGNPVTRIMDTFGVQGDLLVAQIINFCLVSYVLYRFAIKPVLKTVEERQKKISEGLQYAEEMKAQLASAEKERLNLLKKAQEDAQTLFAKTKQESELYLQEQKKSAEKKVEQMLGQAKDAIEVERRNMISEARTEVATLVVATTERLLKDVLTDEMRAKLNSQAVTALKSEPND
jgi:ATP synthase, F0 subunit b